MPKPFVLSLLQMFSVYRCPDFGWHRVSFLSNSWYSAVFWFNIRRMLIIHWCFGCCHLVKDFSSFQCSTNWAECTRSWNGTKPGQLTQAGQKGVPYHMTSCSELKLESGDNCCLGMNSRVGNNCIACCFFCIF